MMSASSFRRSILQSPGRTKRGLDKDEKEMSWQMHLLSSSLTPKWVRALLRPKVSSKCMPAAKQMATLESLPLEILLNIYSELPLESKVALSLVSHHFWFSLSSEDDHISSNRCSKRKLLLLLERDRPQSISCHYCIKLFNWTETRPRHSRCLLERPGHRDHPGIPVYGLPPSYHVFRETVDLTLRHHAWGRGYGLPLYHLRYDVSQSKTRDCSKVRISLKPKIVEERLLLSAHYYTYLDGKKSIDWQLSFLDQVACRHSNLRRHAQAVCGDKRVIGNQQPYANGATVACSRCATDVRITVHQMKYFRMALTVEVWYDFGGRWREEEEDYASLFSRHRERRQAARPFLELVFKRGTYRDVPLHWSTPGHGGWRSM